MTTNQTTERATHWRMDSIDRKSFVINKSKNEAVKIYDLPTESKKLGAGGVGFCKPIPKNCHKCRGSEWCKMAFGGQFSILLL